MKLLQSGEFNIKLLCPLELQKLTIIGSPTNTITFHGLGMYGFENLKRILKKVEDISRALCFLHRGPYQSNTITTRIVQSKLKNASSPLDVNPVDISSWSLHVYGTLVNVCNIHFCHQHQTSVPVGTPKADHYRFPNEYYHFPQLGDGFENLKRILKRVEDIARALCFLHKGPYQKVFRSGYFLKDGTAVTLHIRIVEVSFKNNGAMHALYHAFTTGSRGQEIIDLSSNGSAFVCVQSFKNNGPMHALYHAFTTGSHTLDHRHFRRDAACILEEMLVLVLTEVEQTGTCILEEMLAFVLTEVEQTGIPNGTTTQLFYTLDKPACNPCTGSVMFEVFATKASDSGLKEDEWLT
ncbi:hypothetical protein, conserved [Eimeria praecox]|uniref:Uncharacterized protein n=1 Tax=Eimeria praecox TaxID=51316 RepID=U6GWZ0_9EIME|nr:hypothetical protein, conserved [Eimeria praecox]